MPDVVGCAANLQVRASMAVVLKTVGRYPILPRGFESLALRVILIMSLTCTIITRGLSG